MRADEVTHLGQDANVFVAQEPGRPEPVGHDEEVSAPATLRERLRDLDGARPAVVEGQQPRFARHVAPDELRDGRGRAARRLPQRVEVLAERPDAQLVARRPRASEAARLDVAAHDVVVHQGADPHRAKPFSRAMNEPRSAPRSSWLRRLSRCRRARSATKPSTSEASTYIGELTLTCCMTARDSTTLRTPHQCEARGRAVL